MKNFIEFLDNNGFEKNKDNDPNKKKKSIIMLSIYLVFILLVILFIRLAPAPSEETKDNSNNTSNNEQNTNKDNNDDNEIKELEDFSLSDDDINYSFSYKIVFNGESELYLGKRVGGKSKFTYIKDDITEEYAYINDNFLKLENGVYHLADTFDSYFKYCDVEKIIEIVEDYLPLHFTDDISYNISNVKIARVFEDEIQNENGLTNVIALFIEDGSIKKIKLDFSNYISSVIGTTSTLNIEIDVADVGKTEDFKILFQE